MPASFDSSPRVMIAGLSGDSGKTVVSLGLLLLARRSGIPTAAFKKGPDYIDAAWLSWACGCTARNLDTYLMGREAVAQSFHAHSAPTGFDLIEGNRGLYDGLDSSGTHSSAELAKLLRAPVVLVLNAAKVTRTLAASVLGCQKLDPEVQIAGVILNRVCGRRHETVIRESLEQVCDVPLLGVLPRMDESELLPGRHLGLVTPQEHGQLAKLCASVLSLAEKGLQFDRIMEVARSAASLSIKAPDVSERVNGQGLRIAYLRDSAFTFYYPENLESLERSGAQLIPFSSLTARHVPEAADALYVGGGFPETHAGELSANTDLLASIREAAAGGLPIYAECGGLMLLSDAVCWKGKRFPMAGVLPFEVEVCAKPQGHGYIELEVDRANPYYDLGTRIRGHEFHYSRIVPGISAPPTACRVTRGTGSCAGRDGIFLKNVWASYAHIHAVGTPEWANGFLRQARAYSLRRTNHKQHTDGLELTAKPLAVTR
ncbi:MAG: cobyrinate a,c-diamide synthase [Deltaproteobacteria bacterium]